ncbi:hypothetical protein ACWEQK_28915 [Streptomyces parvulus]
MNDHSPTDPVLSHVEPVPGGLYGDQSYEAALSDLQRTTAEISAALPSADHDAAEHLTGLRRDLVQAQRQLRPDDEDGMHRVRTLCSNVRRYLAGGTA